MGENESVDWHIVGEEFATCSCDWACPCQFEGDPTHGYCRVVVAMQVTEGHFGDVDLTGVKWGELVAFPGPLYEGNGSVQLILDKDSSEEQRDAVMKLASGQYGGTFFEVFSSICPDVHEPVVTSVEVDVDREQRRGTIRLGDLGSAKIEPIVSPATGEEHRVRIDLPNGFEYKQAEIANTVEGKASGEGPLSYSFERSYAQLSQFDWAPAAA